MDRELSFLEAFFHASPPRSFLPSSAIMLGPQVMQPPKSLTRYQSP